MLQLLQNNKKALVTALLALLTVGAAIASGTLAEDQVGEAILATTTLVATVVAVQAKTDNRKLWRYLDAATYGIQQAWTRYQQKEPAQAAIARADAMGIRKDLGKAVAQLGNKVDGVARASPRVA
jgi:hypothetical protein